MPNGNAPLRLPYSEMWSQQDAVPPHNTSPAKSRQIIRTRVSSAGAHSQGSLQTQPLSHARSPHGTAASRRFSVNPPDHQNTKRPVTNAVQQRSSQFARRQELQSNPESRRQPPYKNATDFFQNRGRVVFQKHPRHRCARNHEHSVNSHDRNFEYSPQLHAADGQRTTPPPCEAC